MNELRDWIVEQIRVRGPVTFARYMEWALYHPEWGYYTSDRRKIGKEGDFYTAPSINPVFAEVLADEIAGKGGSARVVIEFGGGEGRLARDMLSRWASEHRAFYEQLTYSIVEISPALRQIQRELVGEHVEKVRWVTEQELQAEANLGTPRLTSSTGAGDARLRGVHGVIVTNELVDAYPVHRVTRTTDGLREIYVTADLQEQYGPLSDPALETYVQTYAPGMIVGQTIEVNLAGLAWYERSLQLLSSGQILTIDYGYEADMLHHLSRRSGTLRGFYRHTLTDDPYQHIGQQDLTADVNFSALRDVGESGGWHTDFFGSQAQYLLQSGILNRLTNAWSADPFRDPDMKRNRAIKSLILPGGLGEHFKVLVQSSPNLYNKTE
ncbi:class I SAM-dependent methyltransferase [Tumebacillus permanentifrigoris]|uniref:SAM-dependent MidA family methyltransferase n=1 Tax=Tumebacillus permanentifrigoris TaxID=378543 RepID=A0A316D414_9BACL|nr:SAM-dependent methyltransferase [Tumebacillus permanentifrigoris]PWK06967.1 SAM-dependent MidA family methyltransferase [Tumebacillus permanentifrigoris]